MNDLLFEFEQQFGIITADITSKTCKLLSKNLPKGMYVYIYIF